MLYQLLPPFRPQIQSHLHITPRCTACLERRPSDMTMARSGVKTRMLILSDTHGLPLEDKLPKQPIDVAIHCGDLTEESKLDEFRVTLRNLQAIDAPLKLVIAGNHDFTLDTPVFRKILEEATPSIDEQLMRKEYGEYDEARGLFMEAQSQGIRFLDEGTHRFLLGNGGTLCVYASPCTPSLGESGFQYHPSQGHFYDIEEDTDSVLTHGPPQGIMGQNTFTGKGWRFGSLRSRRPSTAKAPLLRSHP